MVSQAAGSQVGDGWIILGVFVGVVIGVRLRSLR
jgi:hypothetical protein